MIDEGPGKCPACNDDTLKKQLSSSTPVIKLVSDKGNTAQKRIEKYIEETRVAVAEQMAEARKEI